MLIIFSINLVKLDINDSLFASTYQLDLSALVYCFSLTTNQHQSAISRRNLQPNNLHFFSKVGVESNLAFTLK